MVSSVGNWSFREQVERCERAQTSRTGREEGDTPGRNRNNSAEDRQVTGDWKGWDKGNKDMTGGVYMTKVVKLIRPSRSLMARE